MINDPKYGLPERSVAFAVGLSALSSNITGWDNTAVGFFALLSNTTGYSIPYLSHSYFRYLPLRKMKESISKEWLETLPVKCWLVKK